MTNTNEVITINGHEVKPMTLWVCVSGQIVLITKIDGHGSPIEAILYASHYVGCMWWRADGSSVISCSDTRESWALLRPVTAEDGVWVSLPTLEGPEFTPRSIAGAE